MSAYRDIVAPIRVVPDQGRPSDEDTDDEDEEEVGPEDSASQVGSPASPAAPSKLSLSSKDLGAAIAKLRRKAAKA